MKQGKVANQRSLLVFADLHRIAAYNLTKQYTFLYGSQASLGKFIVTLSDFLICQPEKRAWHLQENLLWRNNKASSQPARF